MNTRRRFWERTEALMRGSGGRAAGGRSARRFGAVFVAGIALGFGSARAQLVSDVVPTDRIVGSKELLDTDITNSRYRLGPVRLLPGFELSNAGYSSNVFGQPQHPVGDWT